jgi:hypothetical protein
MGCVGLCEMCFAGFYGNNKAYTIPERRAVAISVAGRDCGAYIVRKKKGGVMRAEIERAAEEIKQALALLRRHL